MKKKFRCPITGDVFEAMYCRFPDGSKGWLVGNSKYIKIKSKPEDWIEVKADGSLDS